MVDREMKDNVEEWRTTISILGLGFPAEHQLGTCS